MQRKLFTLFANTKLSEKRVNQAGLGLGLTVSHMICQSLGGRLILAQTAEGRGSKFLVILPVEDDFNSVAEESLEKESLLRDKQIHSDSAFSSISR